MVYTKKDDKKQISKAFNMLLIEHDTNLKKFCKDFGYSYQVIYQKLKLDKYHIAHDLINEMVSKLDDKRTLQRLNKKLVITKLY